MSEFYSRNVPFARGETALLLSTCSGTFCAISASGRLSYLVA
jgi:hypothetical protein